jgi:hypothetical protein
MDGDLTEGIHISTGVVNFMFFIEDLGRRPVNAALYPISSIFFDPLIELSEAKVAHLVIIGAEINLRKTTPV